MNPLISGEGICDPHIHIFGDKAYLYATCDNWHPGADQFEMTKWKIFSSSDLIHWEPEETLYPENFYCGPIDMCWAVDAAEKNGKYYWYYSNRFYAVGVGVSDHPGGPFREALGGPLVSEDTPPSDVKKWDPCVFVDDDGSAYLVAGSCFPRHQTLSEGEGNDEYVMARLNEDMISLAEPLRTIPYYGNPNREDKVSIHKENGRYYLTHSSYYAVSDNVYGPYVQMGNTLANIDHGSFFTYHGQTYQATGGMDTPNRYFRSSYLNYCHYRQSGEIVTDPVPMAYGVGQYDASWEKIEAEWFFESLGAKKQERPDGGFEMLMDGWLAFPNTCHLAENTLFEASYRNADPAARLEIHADAPDGPLWGSAALDAGNGRVSCRLSNPEGHRNLYLVLAAGAAALDWFSLGGDKNRSSAEAARGLALGHAKQVEAPGAAADRAILLEAPGDGVVLLLDGGPGGEVETFVRYCANENTNMTILAENGAKALLKLPETGGAFCSVPVKLPMKPGVNRVEFRLDNGSAILDSVRTEQEKSVFKTYPAANGRIYPFGNGCWDGLAQPEWSREAYSGRMVSHLSKPGFRVSIPVDGGKLGGRFGLQIRYRLKGSASLECRTEINGGLGPVVCFAEGASEALTAVELRPGDNEVTLVVLGTSDPGLMVDAVSVVPVHDEK